MPQADNRGQDMRLKLLIQSCIITGSCAEDYETASRQGLCFASRPDFVSRKSPLRHFATQLDSQAITWQLFITRKMACSTPGFVGYCGRSERVPAVGTHRITSLAVINGAIDWLHCIQFRNVPTGVPFLTFCQYFLDMQFGGFCP